MKIRLQVAFYSVMIVFYIVMLSSLIDYIQNRPQTSNGVTIIHAGIEHKER